jgi:hypothetical protein
MVRMDLPGWTEEPPRDEMRVWRDARGQVLSFADAAGSFDLPELSDVIGLQHWCRSLAEGASAGLIEVRVADGALGPTVAFIYKRLQFPAYTYTGMLLVPGPEHLWTVVSGERGMTGTREAVVTARLMAAGTLTIDDYRRSWAQDPYEAGYSGVDRSVLRFMSDDACYDEEFPDHPLSWIRTILAELPAAVRLEPGDGSSALSPKT